MILESNPHKLWLLKPQPFFKRLKSLDYIILFFKYLITQCISQAIMPLFITQL